jgi:hypothetical protein
VYVPKWLLHLCLVVGAVCVGWLVNDALGGADPSSAEQTLSGQALSTTGQAANAPDPPQPVELTIMMGPNGQPTAARSAPTGAPTGASAGAPGQPAYATGPAGPASSATSQVKGPVSAARPTSSATSPVTGPVSAALPARGGAVPVTGQRTLQTGSPVPLTSGPRVISPTTTPVRAPTSSPASQATRSAAPTPTLAAAPTRTSTSAPTPPTSTPTRTIAPRTRPSAPVADANGQVSATGGRLRATTGTSSPATPSNVVLGGAAGAFPRLADPTAPGALPADARAQSPVGGLVVNQTPGMAATAMGQNIVIAYDGAVVLVGDNGYLNANTGDAGMGGMVALEAQGSTFSTSYQQPPGAPAMPSSSLSPGGAGWAPPMATYPTAAWGPGAAMYPSAASGLGMYPPNPWGLGMYPSWASGLGMYPPNPWGLGMYPSSAWGAGTSPSAAWGPGMGAMGTGLSTPLRPGILSGGSPSEVPLNMSPFASAFTSYTQNRTADIAGFEDHSVLVRGTGNVSTYDDSNVFIDRNGKLNANTGDTDSAGLNAVDSLRSTISAGPHCDDGCDNESIIQAQLGVFDEGDVAIDQHGNVVMPDVFDSDNIGVPSVVNPGSTVVPGAGNPGSNEPPADVVAEIIRERDGDDSADDSLPWDTGDDTDSPFDESPDGDLRDLAETRRQADTTRDAADTTREAADTTRAAADTTREAADTTQAAADTTREAADTTRAASDTTREGADATRATAGTGPGAAGTPRLAGGASAVAPRQAPLPAGAAPPPAPVPAPAGSDEDEEEPDVLSPIGGDGILPWEAPAADGSLTVGGDGVDDLGQRVDGVGNVSSYDDSNVVIGGAGDVNAQIGDSDTAGTVTMQTVDSIAHGGNSR